MQKENVVTKEVPFFTSPLEGEDARRAGEGVTKGFTLIELLVVVLIIGILAAVALPQYQKVVYKSQYVKLQSVVASILEAQEIYYLANGQYAATFEELDIDVPGGKTDESTDSAYYYDWGFCWISAAMQVSCANSKIEMSYQAYVKHPGPEEWKIQLADSRVCQATNTVDLNAVQNQICKAETGSSEPSTRSTANNYTSWTYTK